MKGTPELRNRIPGFGRLRVASGTHSVRVLKQLRGMVSGLADAGRFDWLRLLRPPAAMTPLQMWERIGGRDYVKLPRPGTVQPLEELVPPWQAMREKTVSSSQQANDRWAFKRILARSHAPTAVEDLATLLRAERRACLELDQRAAFNRIKAAVLAFLRDTVGRRADVYADVLDIDVLPTHRSREGNPQSVTDALALTVALGPIHGLMWLTTCLTGMGLSEYWGAWDEADEHLAVHGTKRRGRDRMVPLVGAVRPEGGVKLYAAALARVSDGTVQPYDGRRTFAHWMELAGILESRRQAYMGHGPRTMLDLYERHDARRFMDGDRDRLIALIHENMPENLPDWLVNFLPHVTAEVVADITDAPRRSRTPNLLIRSQSAKRARKGKSKRRKSQRKSHSSRTNPESDDALPERMPE